MDEYYKIKRNRCRHAHADLKGLSCQGLSYYCTRCGFANDKVIHGITEEQCETCEFFKSKFIEYPLTINGIDVKTDDCSLRQSDIGKLAKIRPCAEEYQNKTYIGIFLGDLPHAPHISHNEKTGVLTIIPMMNPAIFVPELRKIIYGCESWWQIIQEGEDISKDITDELIQNQWYVRVAKEMFGDKESDGKDEGDD
jgi:hypothetical protein